MGTSRAKRAQVAERRAKAIAMRLAGVDYQTIADRLGYASKGAACTDISRALQHNLNEQKQGADQLREVELRRLDRLQAGIWTQAAGGDPRAVETVLRVIDRRCKLLGLDAPARVAVEAQAIGEDIRALIGELGGDDQGGP